MSEVTIVLRGAVAEKLKRLVSEQHYARPEDAVEDALETLEASRDPALDAWLHEVVANRAKALAAETDRARTPDQVRARLRDQA